MQSYWCYNHFINFAFFQNDALKECQRARLEVENVKRQMLQQEIHHNIQQTEALTRSVILH